MHKQCYTALWLGFVVCAGGMGCAGRAQLVSSSASWSEARGVVFTADGAGGFQATTSSLREAVALEHLPLAVEPLPWSHGRGRILADQVDYGHAREAGRQLAANVTAFRCAYPNKPVYLVGH